MFPQNQAKLEGHQKHITCLAFSHNLNVLESAAAGSQWVPKEADLLITSATYSSNGQSLYVSFKTGCIKFLVSTTLDVYPLFIAAHPSNNPNQIALGLSNDRADILEPLEAEE
ncbi:hypothetical protein QUC31_001360 [Theobroma cacao]